MEDELKAVASLPVDLVEQLETEGSVTRLPIVRSGGPIDADFVIVGAQVATTLVTFAQVPETFDYLSVALSRWRRRNNRDVKLEMKGPQGRVELELTPDTKPADIAAMLRLLGRADAAANKGQDQARE